MEGTTRMYHPLPSDASAPGEKRRWRGCCRRLGIVPLLICGGGVILWLYLRGHHRTKTSNIIVDVTGGPDASLQPQFNATPPWLGGDCATSLAIDNGTYLWIFQDTYVGSISGGERDWDCMPHNSVGVMRHGKLEYFVNECDPWLAPDSTNRWYWPETGLRIGSRFYIFSEVMSLPCSVGCTTVGHSLIVLDVQGDDPSRWPVLQDHLLPNFTDTVAFPTAVVADDETLYVLGRSQEEHAVAARVPLATLQNYSEAAWVDTFEWLAQGQGWTTHPDHLEHLFDDAPPETSLFQFQGWWVVLAIPFGSHHLQARFSADFPGDDWSPAEDLYVIPEPWCCENTFAYSPKYHPELATHPNELVITFMSNSQDLPTVVSDLRLYVPQVIRLNVTLTDPPNATAALRGAPIVAVMQ